jgi:serine phosphatase RsbU (regulator of sigma subunit)
MSLCTACARNHVPDTAAVELARLHEAALPCPSSAPAAFDLALWSRPLEEIGGDVVAAWPVDRDRLLVFLADVMGHDTAAALVASALRLDLYRQRQAGLTSPAEVLGRLDRGVAELFAPYFVTAACCLLDARAGTLTWSLAGHLPLLLREPGGTVRSLRHDAYPLGLMSGEDCDEEVTPLTPGQSLVLYSDGVSDPLGGPAGLACVLAHGEGDAETLVARVRRAVEARQHGDDRALLAVQVRQGR